MIRLAGRESPAEDKKLAARAWVSVLRGCRRASLKHRARGADASAVRGDFARALFSPFAHEAAGLSKARRSARPSQGQGMRIGMQLRLRRPRAANNRGVVARLDSCETP